MTASLYCGRCAALMPFAEFQRVSRAGGAGIVSRTGVAAQVRLYRHSCNWFSVVGWRYGSVVAARKV